MAGGSDCKAFGLIGQVEAFDESVSDWETYDERLTSFFEVNNIQPEKQVHAFLSLIGPKTYALLKSLVSPTPPATKTLAELKQALNEHLSPKPSVIAERAKFHRRVQRDGETIAEFVAELKRLAQTCKFGTHLEETLRDRFVCGLVRVDIQKCLFAEDESLSFKRAVEKALSLEQATRNASECHSTAQVKTEIKKLETDKSAKGGTQCYRCGSNKHKANDCPHKEAKCFQCQKTGHIQRVCKSRGNQNSVHKVNKPAHRGFRSLRTSETDCEKAEICNMKAVSSLPPILYKLTIEDHTLAMELDTGAAVSVISDRQRKELFPAVKLETTPLTLRAYTGEVIHPVGVITEIGRAHV